MLPDEGLFKTLPELLNLPSQLVSVQDSNCQIVLDTLGASLLFELFGKCVTARVREKLFEHLVLFFIRIVPLGCGLP
jgi:hypothetical protein